MDDEAWGRGRRKHLWSRKGVERRGKDGKAGRIFPLGRKKSSQRPEGQRSFLKRQGRVWALRFE